MQLMKNQITSSTVNDVCLGSTIVGLKYIYIYLLWNAGNAFIQVLVHWNHNQTYS